MLIGVETGCGDLGEGAIEAVAWANAGRPSTPGVDANEADRLTDETPGQENLRLGVYRSGKFAL